jgi:hypothetical protein
MSLIRFPPSYVSKQYSGSSGGISGAVSGTSPAMFAGSTINTQYVGEALGAYVSATAFTNGCALNVKWQVITDDNATWVDCVDSYNPANVALVTGAGTSGGTQSAKYFTAPEIVRGGSRSARCVVYGSGSGPANGGTELAAIKYDFRAPIVAYGP